MRRYTTNGLWKRNWSRTHPSLCAILRKRPRATLRSQSSSNCKPTPLTSSTPAQSMASTPKQMPSPKSKTRSVTSRDQLSWKVFALAKASQLIIPSSKSLLTTSKWAKTRCWRRSTSMPIVTTCCSICTPSTRSVRIEHIRQPWIYSTVTSSTS